MASLAQSPLTYDRVSSPKRDAEALVRKHLPLVRRIAWHVHGSMSSIVEVEDLIQIGMVALIEAVNGFEDRGQVTFEQYLVTRVRGAMIDELRRQATLTRGAMKRRKTYQETVSVLTEALGRKPTDAEVAAKLEVTPEKLRLEYANAEAIRFDSIDETYSDESPWFMSEEPNAFDQLADSDQREALIEAIGELPEKEQLVIQLYYVEELNLEEIGQVIGVGAARVCQIKASAHAKLKKGLQKRLG
ncbi:FliA/WhiG family RNA polymerase sigma factor [Sphingomonas sp. G-3-2-10]|uniref:sigma-70 family RNA polymerase sigma factor n=1 Tax=Sphingomonas sp. G-3-2-10 TaxID=2728838 RepID=UPI00146A7333|nr:FliA/WhiG family RNA polymerase sigma factor [Sphingomonas sp. G-3-2-10]NML08125.1 FliA/WhiG family RNA polymerase sigma factor [Sphingomonas sp. G-3-2-10]